MNKDKDKHPRVLIISHNSFSSNSNMGKTFTSFFSGWDPNRLAQLYFHSEVPNINICNNYFRITDFDMLKSRFTFTVPGDIVDHTLINPNAKTSRIDRGIKSKVYNYGKNRKPHIFLIRNLIWSSKKWNSPKLRNWIEDFNPEIVFFAAGSFSFSINIANKICKMYRIPMVVYFGDEYYFYNSNKHSIINLINKFFHKKSFKKMFDYLSCFFAASEKMKIKYSEEFKKPGYAIMTSTEINENYSKKGEILKISYIGNLSLNRWEPLIEIGKVLKKHGILIDVFSGEKRKSVLNLLNEANGIKFHGEVSAKEVRNILSESTILIHVESMKKADRDRTRYSMSTKIAESLGSGTCLFAYGPDDVASIEYLKENEAACVVTDYKKLEEILLEIINNDSLRNKYIENSISLAKKMHNKDENINLFYKIISQIVMNEKK